MREGGPSGEQFLNEKYPDLQHSPEVESVSHRQEIRGGEKPKDKNEKIEAYLSRLEEIFDVENLKHERRVEFLKDKLHESFCVKPKDIPDSYWNLQKRLARERGHGDVEITGEMKAQMAETIIHDQEKSLDAWVDYLGSSDATYPNWLKYFAFRSITKLSQYDKEKKEFKKRSKGTTATFPDINREALAYVLDEVERSHKKEVKQGATDEQWEKLLKTSNFGRLYAYAIEKVTPATEEEKENIKGEWVKYEQGSDHMPLCESLQGHGTGWCTAGEGVAEAQLETGDFFVFYSQNKQGQNKIPRVAIRMENGEIVEVRGIEADQNLEASMTDIAKEKMKELPGAEKYEKKVSDMKRLTEIDNKFEEAKKIREQLYEDIALQDDADFDNLSEVEYLTGGGHSKKMETNAKEKIASEYQKVELSKEELRFLYEIDGPIEGFGYEKDPRIEEIRNQRDKKRDYMMIYDLDCRPEEVAMSQDELNNETKVYIGYFAGRIFGVGGLRFEKAVGEPIPPNLERIIGSASFVFSDVKSLGSIKIIEGGLELNNSRVEDLGRLQRVGKNISVDAGSKLDLSNIQIGGKIIKIENK